MATEPGSDPRVPARPDPARPDPTRIRTPADLAAALAEVKGARSYSSLTTAAGDLTTGAARQASAVEDWAPEALTRGTVSDWLSGRGVPTRAKLLTFLTVSEVPAPQIRAWLAALERIRNDRQVGRPPAAAPRRPLVRRPFVVPLIAVAAIVVVAVVIATTVLGAGGDPAGVAPVADPTSGCSEQEVGPARVVPRVTTDGRDLGMTFCPVVINAGRLPITGPFELAGQVLGPVGERQRVLLVNYGDPRTCDALGNRPPQGGFLAPQALVGSADGRWDYVDPLGYDEAVTIARQFRYITASQDSIDKVKGDAATWMAAHPATPDDYPGILALPADVKVLATFDVPAGEYRGSVPCT